MDVNTGYLNGKLQRVVYMKQPEWPKSRDHFNIVWDLKKALYEQKQAGRVWYQSKKWILNHIMMSDAYFILFSLVKL